MPDDPSGQDDATGKALQRHSDRIDEAVASFTYALGRLIEISQHRLSEYLLKSLTLEGGAIARSAKNIRILRQLPQLWQRSLDDAGLEEVVTAFTDRFPQQIREFESILRTVNHAAKVPLPIPAFTQSDLSYFRAWQQSAAVDLAATVEASASSLRVAPGISFKELSGFIVDKTATAKSRAETIADTSLMGYFRSISDLGYQKIEEKIGKPLLYEFLGPLDKVTSLKCEVAVRQSTAHPWTREYIDTLEPYPGSPIPVFTFGFHYRCRHSFHVSLQNTAT